MPRANSERARSLTLKAIRFFIWTIPAACGVLLLLSFLPVNSWPWRIAITSARVVTTVAALPGMIQGRDPHCSAGEILGRVALDRIMVRKEDVERASTVLRREQGLSLVRTPIGEYWTPSADVLTLCEMVTEHEKDIYAQGGVAVERGDVVLDCGANVGVSVRSALARGAARVVAIEPAPGPLECLRRNLASEIRDGRVIVYPKGVWDSETELVLTVDPRLASTAASVAINRGTPTLKIPVTTIDAIVRELKLPRVDLIKMDIEGAEAAALKGAVGTVATFHPKMTIALEHRPTDPADLGALVALLWPGYATVCGECENIDGHVQPQVLFARFQNK